MLANDGCPNVVNEIFILGTQPQDYCTEHFDSHTEEIKQTPENQQIPEVSEIIEETNEPVMPEESLTIETDET